MAGTTGLRVGDRIGDDEIVGFVVQNAFSMGFPSTAGKRYDADEYGLVRRLYRPEETHLRSYLRDNSSRVSPVPEEVPAYALSALGAERIRTRIFPTGAANAFFTDLVTSAKAQGHRTFVSGGRLRKVLRGRSMEGSDWDLTGTASPEEWWQLVRQTEETVLRTRQIDEPCHLRTDADGHVTVGCSKSLGLTFDYSWLVAERRVHCNSGKQLAWVFGSEVGPDALWRDFDFNALYFDPVEGTILDPLRNGLADLGLTDQDLEGDVCEPSAGSRIRPLDLPPNLAWDQVAKRVARIAKMVAEATTASEAPDMGPVEKWCQRSRERLGELLAESGREVQENEEARAKGGTVSDPQIHKALSEFDCLPINLSTEAIASLVTGLGDTWSEIERIVGDTHARGDDDPPSVTGVEAVALLSFENGHSVPGRIDKPDGRGGDSARRYFGSQFREYERVPWTVRLEGVDGTDAPETEGLCVLRPRNGDETHWYLELRGGAPTFYDDHPEVRRQTIRD